MIRKKALIAYLNEKFGTSELIDFTVLGTGTHGAGFSLKFKAPDGVKDYVIKNLEHHGLGHDYPSDRAAVFLLALEEYKNLPNHVKAIDVLSLLDDGTIQSIGGGREFYLIMERASGTNYFRDLESFGKKEALDERDTAKIRTLTEYLTKIHAEKKDSKCLYWRKIRDTIGHGECLMGVFDSYPKGTMNFREMASIEKKCVDWRMKLKDFHHRLSQVHGDFHPGNIWFRGDSFTLLDRSRGPWGDPADDVTALTINYIFFSIRSFGHITGPYLDAFKLFFHDYMERTGDYELPKVCGLFFAFRGAVVANPVFYPDVTPEQRRQIFRFVQNVLDNDVIELDNIGS